MNILKKITFTVALGLAVVSCTEDAKKGVVLDDTTAIVGTLEMDSEISAPGYPAGFSFTLPQSFDKTAKVTVKATTAQFVQTTAEVTIPANTTSGSGTITMPSLEGINFAGQEKVASVEIAGIALLDETADENGNLVLVNADDDEYVLTSNKVDVTYFDRVQWPYNSGVVNGRMTALFDWSNPNGNDMDMYMFNATTFARVESAESGSRWETDIFNDTHPDGDYFVAVGAYAVSDADVSYKFFFVHPNQTTIDKFEGTFTGLNLGTGTNNLIFPVINFTKSTDANGVVSYTFSQP